MGSAIGRDTPALITGPDGTKVWEGCVIVMNEFVGVCNATTAFARAYQGAAIDSTASFPNPGTLSSNDPGAVNLRVIRPGSGRKGFIGLALHTAAVNGEVKIAGVGSIGMVNTASGSGAAVGDILGNGNANGEVTTTTTAGEGLGNTLIARAVPSGGSLGYSLILVAPR